jgi:hypothetical protein
VKKFAVLIHGRFDSRDNADSAIERMGAQLAASGFDVTTLDCDELLPGRIVRDWKVGDQFYAVGYSNGAEKIVNIVAELAAISLITVQLMILFDPVKKSLASQFFHEALVIPRTVERCIVYLRGHEDEYKGRTQVNDQLTIVPMLTDSILDHGRIVEVAEPEALALLQGAPIPDLSFPVPGRETVA